MFDENTLGKMLTREKVKKGEFDFVLVSKTLHHLRTGKCVAIKRDGKHKRTGKKHCSESEECCIYRFEALDVFRTLLELGKRVIVYENLLPNEDDDDKVRGRGGYFTAKELKDALEELPKEHKVQMITPNKSQLTKEIDIEEQLRKTDSICFYVEAP